MVTTTVATVLAGDVALVALIGCALGAAGVSIVAAARHDARRQRLGLWLLIGSVAAGVVAVVILGRALVGSDFTIAYVVEQSRRNGSAWYRLAGLWGGMAGSLLLWTVMLGASGLIGGFVARASRFAGRTRDRTVEEVAWVQAVMGAIVAGFGLVVATLADPFVRLPAPAIEGQGLTPAMLYHPPLLYAGLASLVAPFAVTVAAALAGRLDRRWLATVRRWVLVPWTLLGVGIVAGAHWAYAEVGWGGYWAWDPVENTALLPWLALTAFIHSAHVRSEARRSASESMSMTAPALVTVAFVLALLGTLLTRSGATQSVHAFAEDPAIGRALAGLVASVAVGAAVVLLRAARRRPVGADAGTPPRPSADPTWRHRLLRLHVAITAVALVVVLVGTTYPLAQTLAGGDEVAAVAGWFFSVFVAPVALVALALAGIGPRLGRRRPSWFGLVMPLGVGIAALAAAWTAGWRTPFALAAVGLGGFTGTISLLDLLRERRGVHLAHLGVAVLMIGIAGSTMGASVNATVAPGGRLSVGGYEVRSGGARVVTEPDDTVQRVAAPVAVLRNGDVVAELTPELLVFRARGEQLAETALWSSPGTDVQVALRGARDDGAALLQVHVRPLLMWVWWGGLMLVAGGAWAFASRVRRYLPAVVPRAPVEADRQRLGMSPTAGTPVTV